MEGLTSAHVTDLFGDEAEEGDGVDVEGHLHATGSRALFRFVIAHSVDGLDLVSGDGQDGVELALVLCVAARALCGEGLHRLVVGLRDWIHLLPGVVHAHRGM
jgi:hypothetical protein